MHMILDKEILTNQLDGILRIWVKGGYIASYKMFRSEIQSDGDGGERFQDEIYIETQTGEKIRIDVR